MSNPIQLERPGRETLKAVTITAEAPNAKEVVLTGDFTNWELEGIPLSKSRHGLWSVTFDLPPGEYEYRLLIDGEWADHREAARRVSNSFGTENCILAVKG